MHLSHLIGKTITNIFVSVELYDGWLDHAECYLEIDGQEVIRIPFSNDTEVRFAELNPNAESLFDWNNMKYIANQKIADIFWFKDDIDLDEPVYIELNNGCIITEVTMFPSGAAAVGLHFFNNINEVLTEKGYTPDDLVRLSDV